MTHDLDPHAQFAAHTTIRIVQIKKGLSAAIDEIRTKPLAQMIRDLKAVEMKLEDLACDCSDEAKKIAALIEKEGK
jgi:hypothetical protein